MVSPSPLRPLSLLGKIFSSSRIAVILALLLSAGAATAQEQFRPIPEATLRAFAARFNPPATVLEELRARGEASRLREKDQGFLVPDPGIRDLVSAIEKNAVPTLAVEALFVYPVDPGLFAREGFDLFTYNTLRSISTMKGIEYYSASRKRMRVMFHDAYVINGPSGTRVKDPILQAVPKEDRIYVHQDDSSFGSNNYETLYRHLNGNFVITMDNLTTMNYGILPLVQPHNLSLLLAVMPGDDYLVFYGYIGVKTLSFFGLERNTWDSFYNRVKALYGWFADQMDKAE